jgi:hypothetical protein
MAHPLRYYTNPSDALCSLLLQVADYHGAHEYVLGLLDKPKPNSLRLNGVT